MKFSKVNKFVWGSIIAMSAAAIAPLPASAQTTAPTQPGTAETTIPGTGTTDIDTDVDNADDGFDWGWLGLIGLAGLAGLAGRKSSDHTYRSDANVDPNISTTRSEYRR